MGEISPKHAQIGLDISNNSARMSETQTVYVVLQTVKPMFLALRRGMYGAIRAIEQVYQLKETEELMDPELGRWIDRRIDERLRQTTLDV